MNAEKRTEYLRSYRAANREKLNAYNRVWRASDPDQKAKQRAYYRERKADPQVRAARAATDLLRSADPVHRAKKAERDRIRQFDPVLRAKRKEQHLLKTYGLSFSDFEKMLADQGNNCANKGCGTTDPGTKYGWVVDHCHATGKVRAILCNPCNVSLGLAKDCERRLLGLVDYVRKHKVVITDGGDN